MQPGLVNLVNHASAGPLVDPATAPLVNPAAAGALIDA